MSGVAVIVYLLVNDAGLTGSVAAAKIHPGPRPLNIALPAIGVIQVDDVPRRTVGMNGAKTMYTERVQVTIEAKTYTSKKAILALVRAALGNRNGTVNGVDLDSILPEGAGPDIDDPQTQIYTQSVDYLVKYRI